MRTSTSGSEIVFLSKPSDVRSKCFINWVYLDRFRVLAEPLRRRGRAGIKLIFQLEKKSRVLSVQFVDNNHVGKDELSRLCQLERGLEYDYWKMDQSKQDMLQLYREHRYRQAHIEARANETSTKDVALLYTVDEGAPTRISRIRFSPNPFRDKKLLAVMDLQPGAIWNQEAIDQSLESLRKFFYKQGHLEAQIRIAKTRYTKTLTEPLDVQVITGPKIKIQFSQNEVFSDTQLEKHLDLSGGILLSPYVLADLEEKLKDLHRRRGYARVQIQAKPIVNNNVKTIRFLVREGPQVAVQRIEFVGNLAFPNRQLQAFITNAMEEELALSALGQVDVGDIDPLGGGHPNRGVPRRVNRKQRLFSDLAPERMYLQKAYVQGRKAIEDYYLSQGFLDVEIGQEILAYDASKKTLYISISISEGPQTLLGSISFGGNQAISADELLTTASQQSRFVKPGGPLDLYGTEQLRRELVRRYASVGYIFCRITQQVEYAKDRTLAEVHYQIDESVRVRVGRILVNGALTTKRKVFDSLLALSPGEVFIPESLNQSKKNLYETGVFTSVDVNLIDPDQIDSVKDVVVEVRERYSHQMRIAPGMSSAEGLRLALGYTHKNLFGYALESVNRAKVNYQVFSEDDRFDGLGGLEWRVVSGLHWPRMWFLGKNVAGRFDLVGSRDHALSYDLTKVSLVPALDLKWIDELSTTLEIELEYIDLKGEFTNFIGRRYDEGQLLLLSVRPELSLDYRDNPFNPHRGIMALIRTEIATYHTLEDPADATGLFAKLAAQLTAYVPLGRTTTFALSTRAGIIHHLTGSKRTPSHKMFYLGGRNNMRGFAEDNLIPSNLENPCPGNDKCVSPGGNSYFVVKSELRFAIWKNILDAAIFLDLGNLWTEPDKFRPTDLRSSAGFGLRLNTPVGPMAFDLGFIIDRDPSRGEPKRQLHFNVGVF